MLKKEKIGYLVAAVLIVLFSSMVYSQENLIPNGGFEEWESGLPVGWVKPKDESAQTMEITQDTEHKTEGKYSVRIQTNICKYSTQLQTSRRIPIKKNTTYLFKGKIRFEKGGMFFEILGYPSKKLIRKVHIYENKMQADIMFPDKHVEYIDIFFDESSGFASFEHRIKTGDTDDEINIQIRNCRRNPDVSTFNVDELSLSKAGLGLGLNNKGE